MCIAILERKIATQIFLQIIFIKLGNTICLKIMYFSVLEIGIFYSIRYVTKKKLDSIFQ